jgi:hypothetical protein
VTVPRITPVELAEDVVARPAMSRRRAAVEIIALVGGVLAIMWLAPLTPWRRPVSRAIMLALVALLITAEARERVGWRALGLRWDNFLPVLGRLAPAIGGFVLVVLSLGWAMGTVQLGTRFYSMLVGVPVWGLLQQYLLLGFAHRRLRVLIDPPQQTVFATAALFGLLHLPNPLLTLACGLGGFVWAREYERSPNLFAHAVTHAIGSAFLANSLPDFLLKNMVVGYRYFLL